MANLSTAADGSAKRQADYPLLRRISLRWADLDTYGHVNNAVHYELIDTAINGWLGEVTDVDIRHELSGIAVVAETGCRYLREIHFPGPVVVGIGLEGLGHSSVRYELGLFIDNESPAAIARFVHVYVDHQTRRPVAIPDLVRIGLDTLHR